MSIVQVAKEAGVSHTTVSRVLNNHPLVAPDTIRRVREAMKRIGYSPPARKRGPRRRSPAGVHRQTIGLLLIGQSHEAFVSPLSTEVLTGVEESLASQSLKLMVGQYRAGGELPSLVSEELVDGLLLYGYLPEQDAPPEFRQLPAVWLMSRAGPVESWGDRVQPDNAGIGYLAANHLVKLGHTRLAFLSTCSQHPMIRSRSESFTLVAETLGASVVHFTQDQHGPLYPLAMNSSLDAVEALAASLAEHRPLPTGLFLPSDMLVPPLYRALRQCDIEPGRDIQVVSCNKSQILEGVHPRPATMDLQPHEIGERAVQQLVWRMAHPHDQGRVEVKMTPQLIPGLTL